MSKSSLREDTQFVNPGPVLVPGSVYLKTDLLKMLGAGDKTWVRWEDAFWDVIQVDVPEKDRRELCAPGTGAALVYADDMIAVRMLRPDKIPDFRKRELRKPPRYHLTVKQE